MDSFYAIILYMFAKKSLGQNFLKSDKAIRQIVESSCVSKTDTILEIGPGQGVLTKKLLETGAKVIAIEKDDRLIIPLSILFKDQIKSGQFVLIHGDVLDFVFMDSMSQDLHNLLGTKYKLIANIPYYITGEIIQRFHTTEYQPAIMTLLVQKEVAQRIIAKDKKESILSIAVKMYGTPKLVDIVPRGAFSPAPNVDSAIITIHHIHHFGTHEEEKEFFTILKLAFGQKRKVMLGNLKMLDAHTLQKVKTQMEMRKINKDARAEDVPLDFWQSVI